MSMVPQIENITHKLYVGTARKKSTYIIFSVGTQSSVTYVNILPVKALF